MELRHLRYFVAAAEEEHFGRAAERLSITRPAVSQLIADLEDELGTQLFERLAHQVRLTAAGKALLPRLQELMADLNQALTMAKRVGDGKSGVITIGYGSLTLLHPIFRATVRTFHELFPEVTLSLLDLPTNSQIEALATGKIDAGFLHFGPPSDDKLLKSRKKGVPAHKREMLDMFHIQSGTLGVIVPSEHRLAEREHVALKDLANEEFVVVPKSSVSPDYGRLYNLCKDAGFEPKIVQEVSSIATQLNLISVGMGIGLTVLGKNFIYPEGVALVQLKGVNYPTSFVLAWPKGRNEPVLENLIQTVQKLTNSSE